MLNNYLTNRKQRVVLSGSSAGYSLVNSGFPQGSVLGLLLFLIYINDLENNIKSYVKFFTGDTIPFSIVKDPTNSAAELNHHLRIIGEWARQWKSLLFNGNEASNVNEHMHRGLFLDAKLSFERHINEKIIRVKKIIGIIKHICNYLSIKTLDLVYNYLVRPHLDYWEIIFHVPSSTNGCLNSLMEKNRENRISNWFGNYWNVAGFQ